MRTDRRHYPRRPARWSVDIRSATGVELIGTSIDVSPDGMQLSLDRSALLRICPRAHLTSRADELDLRLELKTEGESVDGKIQVLARVFNVRRVSQFEYRLGVEFLEFPEESGARRFERLLSSGAATGDLPKRETEPLD